MLQHLDRKSKDIPTCPKHAPMIHDDLLLFVFVAASCHAVHVCKHETLNVSSIIDQSILGTNHGVENRSRVLSRWPKYKMEKPSVYQGNCCL